MCHLNYDWCSSHKHLKFNQFNLITDASVCWNCKAQSFTNTNFKLQELGLEFNNGLLRKLFNLDGIQALVNTVISALVNKRII